MFVSNFTDKYPASSVSCNENAIRDAFTTSWSQGTYIEETSVNTYVINATDVGNGYFEVTWQYDKATAFCNFDVEYVVMMTGYCRYGQCNDGGTNHAVCETAYVLFSHNDEYKAFGRRTTQQCRGRNEL